ncbi:hypothetical protein TNCT_278371 [Trichonephila clavata]|uniref:Uncharacterized protein n=1 Tax=Trichonephila clavata TaxID=2740835 RepID=A0A8X6EZS0_TRICU|nr:hypothetical protein TNCT_278371 [Trichonephila clavata]
MGIRDFSFSHRTSKDFKMHAFVQTLLDVSRNVELVSLIYMKVNVKDVPHKQNYTCMTFCTKGYLTEKLKSFDSHISLLSFISAIRKESRALLVYGQN